MKILSKNIYYLKWIGIMVRAGTEKNQQIPIKIMNIACIVCPMLLMLPSFAYFITYLSDVAKATDAFYMIGILSMTIFTYIFYSKHRHEVENVIVDLQIIVDSSEWNGTKKAKKKTPSLPPGGCVL